MLQGLSDTEELIDNNYKGFKPPHHAWKPDRLDPSEITPKEFYNKYGNFVR